MKMSEGKGAWARWRAWPVELRWLSVGVPWVVVVLGVVAVVQRPRDLGTETGRLVFEDTFERDAPGPAYLQGEPDLNWAKGTWKVEGGRLVGEKIHNAALWLQQALPARVRVDVEVRAETPEGDAKVEVFGDGRTHQSGYIAIAGGWKNTVSCLARRDEHAEERKQDARCGRDRRCVEPGTDYLWSFVRTDNRLRWYVDGQLFLEYDDAHPVDGRHFAFNNWEAKTSFDNLRVYDLDAP
jgi:hypothetical protein